MKWSSESRCRAAFDLLFLVFGRLGVGGIFGGCRDRPLGGLLQFFEVLCESVQRGIAFEIWEFGGGQRSHSLL
jgi:hypothetical protein